MQFYQVHENLELSAKTLDDRRLGSQINELTLMICNAIRDTVDEPERLYKPSHENHPINIWVGKNLTFCVEYWFILNCEWHNRYASDRIELIKFGDLFDNFVGFANKSSEIPLTKSVIKTLEKYDIDYDADYDIEALYSYLICRWIDGDMIYHHRKKHNIETFAQGIDLIEKILSGDKK